MSESVLRVIIVDDEALARQRVRVLLGPESGIEIIAECENGADAVSAITSLKPDLVFLDVQMPELDGFEVIEAVGAEMMPPVIFITAFDDYAVNAFEHGALDYLLKPVEAGKFTKVVARARRRIGDPGSNLHRQLADLLRQVGAGENARIAVKSGGRIVFIPVNEIFWVQARDDIARIHLAETFHDVREPLTKLESRLPKSVFMRVHRSALVNTGKIREVEPFDQGDHLLHLSNGRRVPTSRSYRKAMQEFLKQSG